MTSSTIKTGEHHKIRADLLISGGLILTFNKNKKVLDDGAVAVAGDQIVALDKTSVLSREIEAGEILDASGCLVMPGLINVHT
ncbi:MAG: hypothetical protein PVG64_00540, partial [Syntrophobacterales bacterium]